MLYGLRCTRVRVYYYENLETGCHYPDGHQTWFLSHNNKLYKIIGSSTIYLNIICL